MRMEKVTKKNLPDGTIHKKITTDLEPKWPLFFEGQHPQNKAFSNQNKGHLGSMNKHINKFFVGRKKGRILA